MYALAVRPAVPVDKCVVPYTHVQICIGQGASVGIHDLRGHQRDMGRHQVNCRDLCSPCHCASRVHATYTSRKCSGTG